MNIQLLPKQMQFLQSLARGTMYLGGIGSGKTRVAAMWAIVRSSMATARGGRIVLVVAPTYAIARDAFVRTLQECLLLMGLKPYADYVYNKTTLTFEFPRVSKIRAGAILVRSADKPDSLRGINADDLLIDEFGMLPDDEAYRVAVGRVRGSADGQIRLTGTPTPRKWVKDLVEGGNFEVIRQSSIENTFLPTSYIEDLKKQYGVGSAWYRQEVLGELVDMSTGVIDTHKFIFDVHNGEVAGDIWVRGWDTAASSKTDGDYYATCKMLYHQDGQCHIVDIQRHRGDAAMVSKWAEDIIGRDSNKVYQVVENTQSGSVFVSFLRQRLPTMNVTLVNPTTDKVTRAMHFSIAANLGRVSLAGTIPDIDRRLYLEELSAFPKYEHDDWVDATAYAYNFGRNATIGKVQQFTHKIF